MRLTPTQNVAVDLIIIAYDRNDHMVKLYTPKREVEPAKGQPALPGVLLQEGEHISSAVQRTIKDKTQLDELTYNLQELPARTNPYRDERGHVMSIPTLVLLHGQNNFDEDWVPFATGKIEGIKAHIHKETTKPSTNAPIIIIDDLSSYGGTFVGAIKAVETDLGIKSNNNWLIVTHAEEAIDMGQVPVTFSHIFTTDSIAKPQGYTNMSDSEYDEQKQVFIRPVLDIINEVNK